MQIDFVVFRRGVNPLRAFTASLGYSRMSYVYFTDNERAETWASCIEKSLEAFGGVPRSILCDNAKSLVTTRNAYGKGKHRLHSLILDLAKHYGFRVHLCRPYRAQTKGKVERFHRYLRESFYVPLQAKLGTVQIDQVTANHRVQEWLSEVANVRIHATLKEHPINRFAFEYPNLARFPLPYQVLSVRTDQRIHLRSIPQIVPVESLQHPLHIYEDFASEIQG